MSENLSFAHAVPTCSDLGSKLLSDLPIAVQLKLIELPALPPVSQPSPTAQQELLLASG